MRRRIERLETLMDLSEAGQISASAQPNTEVSLSLRLPTGEAPGETVQVHNIEDKYVICNMYM